MGRSVIAGNVVLSASRARPGSAARVPARSSKYARIRSAEGSGSAGFAGDASAARRLRSSRSLASSARSRCTIAWTSSLSASSPASRSTRATWRPISSSSAVVVGALARRALS